MKFLYPPDSSVVLVGDIKFQSRGALTIIAVHNGLLAVATRRFCRFEPQVQNLSKLVDWCLTNGQYMVSLLFCFAYLLFPFYLFIHVFIYVFIYLFIYLFICDFVVILCFVFMLLLLLIFVFVCLFFIFQFSVRSVKWKIKVLIR